MVVAPRHQHAHVDTVARRPLERFHHAERRDEVRGGNPQPLACGGGLYFQRARHAKATRLSLDDAHEGRRGVGEIDPRVAGRPYHAARLSSCRPSAHRAQPHGVEGSLHGLGSRSLDLYSGIAPWRALRSHRTESPLLADADAAGDPHLPVGNQQLSVIARQESKPAPQSRRAEDADIHAARAQRLPYPPRRTSSAHPVHEQPCAHATLGCGDHRPHELLADLVLPPEDVGFQLDRVPDGGDHREHRLEGRRPILQQHGTVALRNVGRGHAPEHARKARRFRGAGRSGTGGVGGVGWRGWHQGGSCALCQRRGSRARPFSR